MLLMAVAILALVGGVWWFVVRPAGAETAAQRAELVSVRGEIGGMRDTIARLGANPVGEADRTSERLLLAEALPAQPDTPGAILQLHRLADQANVELTSVRVDAVQDLGALRSTEYEVQVTGRFFEVDDFLYRVHRLVVVTEDGRPSIAGRLFATTAIDFNLAAATGASSGIALEDTDPVIARVRLRTFSTDGGAGAADVATPAPVPGEAP